MPITYKGNEMLRIKWKSGDAKDYTDQIPDDWLIPNVRIESGTHSVIAPKGGKYRAKCSVSSKGSSFLLDYSAFIDFNKKQWMSIGVMRLKISINKNRRVAKVYWKSNKSDKFYLCDVDASFEANAGMATEKQQSESVMGGEIYTGFKNVLSENKFRKIEIDALNALNNSGELGLTALELQSFCGFRTMGEANILMANIGKKIKKSISKFGKSVPSLPLYLYVADPDKSHYASTSGHYKWILRKEIVEQLNYESDSSLVDPIAASEGRKYSVQNSRFERSRILRERCLHHYGLSCQVCKMSFKETYGEINPGYIEVHHINPLMNGERSTNPINDMIPLCSNCHSMAHQEQPPISISDLKKAFNSQKEKAKL